MIKKAKVINEFIDSLISYPRTPEDVKHGGDYYYKWDSSLPFSSKSYASEISKNPDKDFVILNFADIQCHDEEAFSEVGEFYEETIDNLIKKTHPDLITLTGDNAFDPFAYLRLIRFIESYNIPWAPVMGNADHDGLVSEFWAAYQLCGAKNCLFKCGPEEMGDGNYIINITENGKIIHTLFMMDTHHEGEMHEDSYDHFYTNQIEWYKWAVKGIENETGKIVPSSVFMHIPVPEYVDAWQSVIDENGNLKQKYASLPFCKMQEKCGCPEFNNNFFEICRELQSTKNMICGHEHTNCFSINYKGINLTYAMKTGYGCYWEHKTHGGITLKIDSDGNTQTDFHYINPKESKNESFLDWYNNIYLPNLKK